jgi:hypothetical protein
MANLFWTIVPFVLTFVIATRTPAEQPEHAPARRKSNPCLG